jgi:mevalonate kinase
MVVSRFGGALAYTNAPKRMDLITTMPQLRILVTNTKVPKNTKALVAGASGPWLPRVELPTPLPPRPVPRRPLSCAVFQSPLFPRHLPPASTFTPPAGVRVLRERLPLVIDPVLQAIDGISTTFVDAVRPKEASGGPSDQGALYARVCELVDVNMGLLRLLGVGHPALDALCDASARHGLHSKLTGAGGGGCGFTLLPPDLPAATLAALVAELTAAGFECFETSAGGPGVLFHPPTSA